MKNLKDSLTSLEGAILGAIEASEEALTTYQVRKLFRSSPSVEWRGSAGAIYPAIKRLAKAGFLDTAAREGDDRGSKFLNLTESGRMKLAEWTADVKDATGPGLDPFRLRARSWAQLDAAERKILFAQLETAIKMRMSELSAHAEIDPAIELDLALQQTRLDWLKRAKR